MKKEQIRGVAGAKTTYDTQGKPHLFIFVLLDGCSHLSLVSALETVIGGAILDHGSGGVVRSRAA